MLISGPDPAGPHVFQNRAAQVTADPVIDESGCIILRAAQCQRDIITEVQVAVDQLCFHIQRKTGDPHTRLLFPTGIGKKTYSSARKAFPRLSLLQRVVYFLQDGIPVIDAENFQWIKGKVQFEKTREGDFVLKRGGSIKNKKTTEKTVILTAFECIFIYLMV